MRRTFGVCFAMIFWSTSFCQSPFVVAYLGVSDGLPSININGVAQDSQGLIWFSSLGAGLIRYDGSSYKVFNQSPESKPRLSSNHARDVVVDRKGHLWIAHMEGIDILLPGSLEIIQRIPLYDQDKTVNAQACCLYLDPSGDMWVATYNKGVFRFPNSDPNRPILVDTLPEALYINRSTTGKIFCISTLKGMYVLENEHFIPTFPRLIFENQVRSQIISIENHNGLLTGFSMVLPDERTVPYHLNLQTGHFEPGMPVDGISALTIPEFSKKILELASPLTQTPLFQHALRTFKDNQSLVWVVMENGGVFKLKTREMNFTTCAELQGLSLRGMLEAPDGSIYIATYNGVFQYFPRQNKAKKLSNKGRDIFFQLAQIQGDTITALSESVGIVNYKLQTSWEKKAPISSLTKDYSFFASLLLPDGSILAGNHQIFKIRQKDLKVEPVCTLPDTQTSVRTFCFKHVRNGDIWIGTSDGVFVLSNGRCKTPAIRKDHRLGTQSRINDIFEDKDGKLWFATHNYGLIYYDLATEKTTVFDQTSGFTSNETYKIAASHQGKTIWVSTFSGLQCIELPSFRIHIFNASDGTCGNEFNTGSGLQARNGIYYFGGVRGLTRFNPDHLKPSASPASKPYVSELFIEDIYSNVIKTINLPKRDTLLQLSNSQNTLEFHFGSNDYFRPKNNTYFVQLENIDAEWVPLGSLTSIKYYRLAAGYYTLRVKFNINGDKSSDQIFVISFVIDEVFYRKWWFLSLIGVFLTGAIGGIIQMRRRRFKREENLRRSIAHGLHNTLGGNISSISNMVHLIDRLNKTGQPFQTELHQMLYLTRKAHSTMSDVIWVLSQPEKMNAALLNRMEDYADKWLKLAHIQVVFEHNLVNQEKTIPFRIQHELLLVYKEILGNVLKHTFSEKVFIHFITHPDHKMDLVVRNVFNERKTDVPSSGQGLKIIKEHLEQINGVLSTTETENSFEVRVRIENPYKRFRHK